MGVDVCKQEILEKLASAESKGQNKGKLGISSALKTQALKELEAAGEVINLEVGRRYLFVLKDYYKPLEMACEQLERKMCARKNALFSKTKLLKESKKGCPGKVRRELENALGWLVKENKVLRLKSGRISYFVHALAIHPPISAIQNNETVFAAADKEKILSAYERVKADLGFSTIKISELKAACGVNADLLKEFLLEESRAGRAVLSWGDWSLASEEDRASAVHIDGKPHLMVKFK